MVIRKQIFMNGYPCLMDVSLQLSIVLWISIWISLDFYGYPCIDLLWILDPGVLPSLLPAHLLLLQIHKTFHPFS